MESASLGKPAARKGKRRPSVGTYRVERVRASFVNETPSLPYMSCFAVVPDKLNTQAHASSLLVSGTTDRERLKQVLAGDLAFHEHSSTYGSHAIHAFAAKFPPQLPGVFIENLTRPGEIVLDPMVGSGTTVVEAALRGRRGIGVDIDPLARLLCRVKTTQVSAVELAWAGERVLGEAREMAAAPDRVEHALGQLDRESRAFIDYWFLRPTQIELISLVTSISNVEPTELREYLLAVFSSVIITKSGGVSQAMDLAHSRPHKVHDKLPRSAVKQFEVRLGKVIRGLAALPPDAPETQILAGDARDLPLEDSSVDLVVTSPPYANAIDYMRAHKFSLVWMGLPLKELSDLRGGYIGAERINVDLKQSLPETAEALLTKLNALDSKRARVLRQYFIEMRGAIAEMKRVLRPGRSAVIVVGPSTMRGLEIPTPDILGNIASELGFEVAGIVPRPLDRNRRMMPARFKNNGQTMIENRMHEEHIVALVKPESPHAKQSSDRRRSRSAVR